MKRVITQYTVRSVRIPERLKMAVCPDLHSAAYDDVKDVLVQCDAVLIPGDLVDRHRRDNRNAEKFLEEIPLLVPVFYSLGNHEVKFGKAELWKERILRSEAVLLDNESCNFHGIRLGGLSSRKRSDPDISFLERFEQEEGFRLLLCHHPEVYRDFVRGRDIDLTLCGHAHGGQIQFFGRGIYAPGQGLFPKLTHGIRDGGRLIISRGMTNGSKPHVPRINNPCELILLTMEPQEEGVKNGSGRSETADGLV